MGIITLRNKLYDLNILSSVSVNAKIICVGNITTGGTGKTPLVMTIARLLQKEGYNVGILSRGYARKKKGQVLVSDGKTVLVSAWEGGDEPVMLARQLSGVPVIASKNRLWGVDWMIDHFGCDVIILDDAFQHRRIKRNLDIVTIDANNPWGNGWVLPAGPLREPRLSLNRVDCVILTRAENSNFSEITFDRIQKWTSAPVYKTSHKPIAWISHKDNIPHTLKCLRNKPVLAFTGTGNPESFKETLKCLDVHVTSFTSFRDHYWYRNREIESLIQKAKQEKAEAIVTTEKDGVRIPPSWAHDHFYCLQIECQFQDAFDHFKNQIIKSIMS